MGPWTRAVWIVLLTLGVSACGGGDGSDAPPADQGGGSSSSSSASSDDSSSSSSESSDDDVDDTADCSAVTWSKTEAVALDSIKLENLSGSLAEAVNDSEAALYAEARPAGEPDQPFLPVPVVVDEQAEELTLSMAAPMNIEDVFASQSFDIKLVAGDVTCAARTLDVEGIQPLAEGADPIGDYLSTMEALLVDRASTEGYTSYDALVTRREEFIASDSPGVPSPAMISVLLAVEGLEEFRAEIEGLSEADREVFAAYMAQVGFAESMQSYREALPEPANLASYTGSRSTRHIPQGRKPEVYSVDPSRNAVRPTSSACSLLPGDPVSINSAIELHEAMEEQHAAAENLSGYSGSTREAATMGLPVLGAVSGGAGTAAGALLYLDTSYRQFTKNTLPSELSNLRFEIYPDLNIPEDFQQAEGKPYWHEARLNASSRGHDFTKTAIDAVSQVVAAGRWGKGLDAPDTLENTARGFAEDLFQNEVFNQLKEAAEGGAADDGGCLGVPAHEWQNIDVSEPGFIEATVYGDSLSLGTRYTSPPREELVLERIGSSEVRLETPDNMFPGDDAVRSEFVDVLEQNLRWDPAAEQVDNLGTQIDYTLTVENTARQTPDPNIDVPSGVSLVRGPTLEGYNPFRATYSVTLGTPSDKEDYPAEITASRNAVLPPTGARTGDTALIIDQRLEVIPANACVQPDDTQTLTATVVGLSDDDSLSWVVTSGPGSVTPVDTEGSTRSAEVSPTADEGEIQVRASAETGEGEVSDTARIVVGSCDAPLHVWGAAVYDANAGNDSSGYNENLEPAPQPPERPDSYWQGRSETLASTESASGYVFWDQFDAIDGYEGVLVSALSQGELKLVTDAEGVLTYSHETSTLTDECESNPQPEVFDKSVDCSTAQSSGAAIAQYYIEHEAVTTYEIQVEGQCDFGGDAFAGAFVTISANRYVGEAPEDVGPLNGPFQDYEDYSYGEFINPQIIGTQDAENVCGSSLGGTFSFSRTVEVGPPVESGQPDLVHVSVTLGSMAANNHHPGYEPTENLTYGGSGSIQHLPPQEDPATGSYSGNADFEFSVTVEEQ